mgnify:CR=1 FL=1
MQSNGKKKKKKKVIEGDSEGVTSLGDLTNDGATRPHASWIRWHESNWAKL